MRGSHIFECAQDQRKIKNDPGISICEESFTVTDTESLTESDLISTSSCSEPPEAVNGEWKCDKELRTCTLQCKKGYILLQDVTARYALQLYT